MAKPRVKPHVVPGQVWRDCDLRMRMRSLLTVIAVEGDKAVLRDVSGRVTRVSVARMRPTSTGFELVKDVPAEDNGKRALEVLRDIEFSYPPTDALSGTWEGAARCPMCFREWPQHRAACAIAEVLEATSDE